MKHCPNCNLDVRTSEKLCPLCQCELSGTDEREVFPSIPSYYKKFALFFKIFNLSSIAAAIVAIMLNFMLPSDGFWSLFVVVGIFCTWVFVVFSIKRRYNVIRTVTYCGILGIIFSFVWDYMTVWHGWSVAYVLPIMPTASMIACFVVALCLKIAVGDYIMYLLLSGVIGLAPIVSLLFFEIDPTLPSYICVTISAISLFAILIFLGKNLLNELQKRLHV